MYKRQRLFCNDPSRYDGHQGPARTAGEGDVAKHIVLSLILETSHTPLSLGNGIFKALHRIVIVILEVDDVKEIPEGAVAVGMERAHQDIPFRINNIRKARVSIEGKGESLRYIVQWQRSLNITRFSIKKGKAFIIAQCPHAAVRCV